MSLLTVKPFNYPIAVNVEVTKSTQINDDNWSFVIQFTSNVTTWEIIHTLSEFEQLHNKLRDCQTLQSIKLPRSITQTPSEFKESHKQIIEEYLWKLCRRAHIFISLPLQTFIQLPIIMEQKTNYMSKQLNIIIREDIIFYSIDNNNKYINIQCILRSSYIFDAYKVIQNNDDYLIRNELNEGFGDNKNKLLFRIDVVQIKRVLKYQKEFKFAIETRKGIMYAFKCKNKMQFNHWLNDIKNMIKAQGGCTPYLSKWENNGIEYDQIDEKINDKMDMYEDDSLDLFDFENTRGPLSTISEKTGITSISDEKHDEYLMDAIDIVDLDIKSVIDDDNSDTNNNNSQSNNSNTNVSIEHTIYNTTEDEIDDDDDDDDRDIFTQTLQTKYIANHDSINDTNNDNESYSDNSNSNSNNNNNNNNSDGNKSGITSFNDENSEHSISNEHDNGNDGDNESIQSDCNLGSKYIEDSDREQSELTYDSITLKMQANEVEKPRRNSNVEVQKGRMIRDQRDRFNDMDINDIKIDINNDNDNATAAANIVTYDTIKNECDLSLEYDVINYNYIGYKKNINICNINEHNNMIHIEDYNLLKEQMFLWQSKANRWEAMANKFERHIQKMELKLRDKEGKYKHKIKDQSNEILTLTKLYNCAQCDLENKIIELKQLESASNIAIQQLISYKNKNEMRKKNSYIDGTLWKFTGGKNNIKFNKAPRLKYVMYVPTKRKLYYSDSQHDDAETKLVNVTHISHRNQDLMTSLPNKYKNIWIKIIGQNRIVLFVAKNEEDADRWYDTIKNSLQMYNDDD